MGYSSGLVIKNLPANTRDSGEASSSPGSGRYPRGGNGNPLIAFLPGESHRQRSLVGCSPWSHKELATAEPLGTHTHMHSFTRYYVQGEGYCL